MIDFITDIVGLLLRWILYTAVALFLLYFVLRHIAWRMGLRSYFDKYIDAILEWIRDAFRD